MKKNNLKNERGVTITSVLIYIIALTAVVIIIGRISTYFYRNMDQVTTNTAAAAEYTKFNSYFTDEINIEGNEVEFWEPNLIIFSKSENQYTFQGNGIYRNKVKICKDVEACTFSYNEDTKKIDVYLKIYNREYNVTYTVAKEVTVSGGGTNKKTLVEMFKQAQADGCTLTHETCTNKEHLHIGDYLDYKATEGTSATVDTSKTGYSELQTYTVDNNTTWRVVGLNDTETELVITTGSPIKRDGDDIYLHLKGAYAYKYCEEILDKICKIYINSYASNVRSMRIEDINTALGIVKEENVVYKKNDASKTNIDQLGVLGQTYKYKSGDYAPENYLYEAGVTTEQRKSVGDTVTGTAYSYNYTDSSIIDQNSTLWNVLFDGTTSDKNYAKSYWLASPGVNGYSERCFFRTWRCWRRQRWPRLQCFPFGWACPWWLVFGSPRSFSKI